MGDWTTTTTTLSNHAAENIFQSSSHHQFNMSEKPTKVVVRHVFDPDGEVLLTISIPENSTDTKPAEQAKNNVSGGSHVEMLVSAKHLMLASPVFKSMLQPHFTEGLALRSTGHVTIPLFDDDPNALKIVMNIIHSQAKNIPQQLGLKEFAHVAVLVDKYDLHNMVDHYALGWHEKLKGKLPKSGYTDLYPWLCIGWVFKLRGLFSHTTMLAIRYSGGDLYEGIVEGYPVDFPMPIAIFGMLQHIFNYMMRLIGNLQRELKMSGSAASRLLFQSWKMPSRNSRITQLFTAYAQQSYSLRNTLTKPRQASC